MGQQHVEEIIDWHQHRIEEIEKWASEKIVADRPVFTVRLKGASFEGFRPEVKKAALKAVEGPNGSMHVWGGTGAGKSWLAAATALYVWDVIYENARVAFMDKVRKEVIPRARMEVTILGEHTYQSWDLPSPLRPRLYNVPRLIDKLKSEFGKEEQMNIIDLARNPANVIFDDIGVGNMTTWAQEQIYLFVNERYERMLPTFYTSNLSPDALAEVVGERIASRIIGSCEIIGLKHEDRRKPKKV